MATRAQSRDAAERRARVAEAKIARAYLRAVAALRVQVDGVLQASRRNQHLDVAAALRDLPIERAFAGMADAVADALAAGAKTEARAAGVEAAAAKVKDDLEERLQIIDALATEAAETSGATLVARVSASTRSALRSVIADGIRENMTIEQIARAARSSIGLLPRDARALTRVRSALLADGVSAAAADARVARRAQVMVNRRARTIARTEVASATNTARATEWQMAVSQGELPRDMLRAWIAKDPCPVCIALSENDPVGLDQPFVDEDGEEYMRPPAHPNCLPGDALVTSGARVTASSERRHDGHLVIIRTASGEKVTTTPNHPILTDCGWLPASAIDVARKLVRVAPGQPRERRDVQHEHIPTRIEQVAQAVGGARKVAAVPVPTTAEDFHGDGMAGQVAVVRADRLLRSHRDSARIKHAMERTFSVRPDAAARVGSGALFTFCDRHRAAAHRLMGRSGKARAPIGPLVRHANESSGAATSAMHTGLKQQPRHYWSGDGEAAGQGKLTLASGVSFDQVVRVDVVPFAGHVFNLETESDWYLAGRIVVHNCKCSVVLVRPNRG